MVLIFVLFCFAFSLLRFMFFGWSYRPFVLGQSVPPPPHLPGGFPEKPNLFTAKAFCFPNIELSVVFPFSEQRHRESGEEGVGGVRGLQIAWGVRPGIL